MSNLKQIALASAMYVQDYDEKYPRYIINGYATASATNPSGWADAMDAYIKNEQVFQCPSEGTAQNQYPSARDRHANPAWNDYWLNNNVSMISLAAFDAPSMTVLIGDGQANDTDADTNIQGNVTGGKAYYAHNGAVKGIGDYAAFQGASRHLDGANVAFADGHVKWQKGYGGTHPEYSQSVYVRSIGTDKGAPTFSIKAAGQ